MSKVDGYSVWYNNLGQDPSRDPSDNNLMEFYYPYSYFYQDNEGVFAEFILKIRPNDIVEDLERTDTIEAGKELITLTLNIKKGKSSDKGWSIVYFDKIKIDPLPQAPDSRICITLGGGKAANEAEAKVIVRYGDVSGPSTN
jgi:hypothetical protein